MSVATAEVALRCSQLTKRWGRGDTVLHDVDFELAAGEWLSIIGPNGAGKSTLLHALAGLTDHAGSVLLGDGRRVAAVDVALVPQKPVLPTGMSVAEYVLIGRTAHLGWLARESRRDRDIVASTLRRLELARFGNRSVTELSGGETQRVVVARALAQQSPVLLLDEPTTALDIGHQSAVLEMIDDMRRADGISVVAAMHDLGHAAHFSDRLLLLDRGHVAALGPVGDVLTEALLSKVYATPVRVRRVDGDLVVLPGRT